MKQYKSEKQLQANMVIEFSQKYPELKGRLFATFSETTSKIQGSNRISLGLIRGISDLIFIRPDKRLIGIEVKLQGKRHKVEHVLEQCDWLENNTYRGYFCTSISMFWDIIYGGEGITIPEARKMCEGKKTVVF